MDDLKEEILNLGASLVGFANINKYLLKNLLRYPYGVSIAIELDKKIIDEIKDGPTKEYENLYKKVNDKLNRIALETKKAVEKKGIGRL